MGNLPSTTELKFGKALSSRQLRVLYLSRGEAQILDIRLSASLADQEIA
jgi:hypothetical protein